MYHALINGLDCYVTDSLFCVSLLFCMIIKLPGYQVGLEGPDLKLILYILQHHRFFFFGIMY